MVAEGHQGGEDIQDDFRVDEVGPFPYGVGDPVRAWGRVGGKLRQGESYFILE